ncbi:hypothetical protein [Dactylosporangium siamense]|uniref:Uncharacterized protein n=1 Tax=Dactylosporangium siamense TaxID=685454 RepID=A0A919UAX5_9ACTN|nr:hypothetical protein [Dactylosporangium siamense]GIG44966.1 hypothetical protein Dsi01nite_030070 [Dactylosporangium siamense]
MGILAGRSRRPQATRQLEGAFLREVAETGSGKSRASRWSDRHIRVTRPAWVVHCADLVQHHEWSLETKLFDVIEAAVHVDGRQHVLLLDSVDECKARAGTLAGILEAGFRS